MNKRVTDCTLILTLLLSGCASGMAHNRTATRLLDLSHEEDALNEDQIKIISIAKELRGTPYRFGGTNPKTGMDCSGYVAYVFQQAVGLSLPREAHEQIKTGRAVSDSLQQGDMVYFNISGHNRSRRSGWHTGIYIGKGKFIHAPSTHGVVNIQEINLPYWQERFFGARRLL